MSGCSGCQCKGGVFDPTGGSGMSAVENLGEAAVHVCRGCRCRHDHTAVICTLVGPMCAVLSVHMVTGLPSAARGAGTRRRSWPSPRWPPEQFCHGQGGDCRPWQGVPSRPSAACYSCHCCCARLVLVDYRAGCRGCRGWGWRVNLKGLVRMDVTHSKPHS